MTRPQLIAECRSLHIRVKGGLTRLRKAELVDLLAERQQAIAEYNALVKPYKVEERVDRREIDRIRHEAFVSPLNIDHWRDGCIAEIEAAQDRLVAEYATREEAEQEAASRNARARRGFRYDVVCINATLKELRSR